MKIDWYGNVGRSYPMPETVQESRCGICGILMKVERNVLRTTSLAEAYSGGSHKCDAFTCPHVSEDWHKRICKLKTDVYLAEIHEDVDYQKKKRAAEKEIRKLLKKHAAAPTG